MIFFLSDFGLEDAYVGVVKAVIAGIAPEARVVDLAHGLPPQDLRRAAYQLHEAVPYLPPGSIVLAVVDPGVGSERRAVAVEGARCRYVVPDNGLLSLVFEHDPPVGAHALEDPRFRLSEVRRTFHGRDVFGPAAAHLAAGVSPAELGPPVPVGDLVRLPIGLVDGDAGEVLTFDRFGNAITNLRQPASGAVAVRAAGRRLPLVTHYAAVGPGEPLALVGSAGLVEISVRDGDARAGLGLAEGHPVQILR
ncbi:MAG: SAM hydrolase/SAM-dependent halogenase family protein [Myxococcota bacterium]